MMKELHEGKSRYELRPGRKREDCLRNEYYFTSEIKEGKNGQVQEILLHWTSTNYKGKVYKTCAQAPVHVRLYDNDKVFSHYDDKKRQLVFIYYDTALDREIKRHIMNDWLVKDNAAIAVYF